MMRSRVRIPPEELHNAGWTGEVPAGSHKPNDGGSNPSPATDSSIPAIQLMILDRPLVVGLSVDI